VVPTRKGGVEAGGVRGGGGGRRVRRRRRRSECPMRKESYRGRGVRRCHWKGSKLFFETPNFN